MGECPEAQELGQVLGTGAPWGDRTWGWGTDIGAQEGGGSRRPGLPRQGTQVLSAQGGLCFKGKMVPADITESCASTWQSYPPRCLPAALNY